MRIAIILRGGVSKRQGRQLGVIGSNENSADSYINLRPCVNSFKRHILDVNNLESIDIYIHSWDPLLSNELCNLYSPQLIFSEKNYRYSRDIWRRVSESYYHQSSKNLLSILNYYKILFEKNYDLYGGDFAGISQALAIKKGIELAIQAEDPNCPYDAFFIYRPDLILLKDIIFNNYKLDQITCNNFRGELGDFHFFIPRKYVEPFRDLYDSPMLGNFHDVHQWIGRYVKEYLKVPYGSDNIVAGIDQEVLRKIRSSAITYDQGSSYGLTQSEWNEYDKSIL